MATHRGLIVPRWSECKMLWTMQGLQRQDIHFLYAESKSYSMFTFLARSWACWEKVLKSENVWQVSWCYPLTVSSSPALGLLGTFTPQFETETLLEGFSQHLVAFQTWIFQWKIIFLCSDHMNCVRGADIKSSAWFWVQSCLQRLQLMANTAGGLIGGKPMGDCFCRQSLPSEKKICCNSVVARWFHID